MKNTEILIKMMDLFDQFSDEGSKDDSAVVLAIHWGEGKMTVAHAGDKDVVMAVAAEIKELVDSSLEEDDESERKRETH